VTRDIRIKHKIDQTVGWWCYATLLWKYLYDCKKRLLFVFDS